MRIAVVHSYYSSRQPSGENVVVDAQVAALRQAGHEVLVVGQHTDELERHLTYPLKAAWTVATGKGPDPTATLTAFRPDIIHVHNLFPNFGTHWLENWQGPVVATLHNFRPMCAAATLYRDGEVCTLCPDGDPGAALRHSCYRGSKIATVPLAIGRRGGIESDPVVGRAEALVALSARTKSLYETYGVRPERVHLVPNFVDDPYAGGWPTGVPNDRWLFVGRLSPEKGITELVQAWPEGYDLDVYGDGPLRSTVARAAPDRIRLLGEIDRADLRAVMPAYQGLVFPSRWFEGMPSVFLEAFAAGLPIVAVEGSTVGDEVAGSGLGLTLARDAGADEWAAALAAVASLRHRLSPLARSEYERLYTEPAWMEAIERVYARAQIRASAVA
jgi:glycosyltransferase involved in cell wall biosynthesis